jgi:HD-GYP domain-containing protein (c-di-GMP phosphodiesterase class II)
MTEPTDPGSQNNSSQKLDIKKKAAPRAQRGREAKIQKLGKQAISTLFLLVRNVKMHDADNAIFAQPLENLRQCINTIVAIDGQFQLNAIGTTIYINGKQLKLDFSALDNVRYLTDQFQEKDVGGFDVKHPVQTQELKDFIWIFGASNEADCDEDGVEGHRLANIKVGKFARIKEQLDRIEDQQIEAQRKVDRKKYALTVYARLVFYMQKFVERLQSGGQLPSMQPAARLVQDLVDICMENRSHFLGMTTTRSVDDYLLYHSINTCLISVVFGTELGLGRSQLHDLGMAALFHDIGIAEVDPAIINKKRALTPDERRVLDLYPLHTVKTLLKGRTLDQQTVQRLIIAYESKIDYSKPMKTQNGKVKLMLPKVELGLCGRIIGIAATYDALTSARPFREAYGPEVAMTLMISQMKYKFDPWLSKVFMRVMAIQPVRVLEQAERKIQMG